MSSPSCRLCGGEAPLRFRQRVLTKYDVGYFRCATCDLLQTESAYWLDEAYSDALSEFDSGAVSRVLSSGNLVRLLGHLLGISGDDLCFDLGGNSGLFARLMRDRGFNFFWWDKYAKNIYCRGFEGSPSTRYRLVTAFEVFEHFHDVKAELDALFAPGHDLILAATCLNWDYDHTWWYLAPETGQHIAFYSPKTMGYIADKYGYVAVPTHTHTLFIKTQNATSPRRAWIASKVMPRKQLVNFWGSFLNVVFARKSWAERDVQTIRARHTEKYLGAIPSRA